MLATSSRTTDKTVRNIARNYCWRHVSAVSSRRSGALPCEAFEHRICPSPNRYCLATMASTILADAASAWVFGLITTPFGWRWADYGRPLEADPWPVGTGSPTLRWSRSRPSRRPTGSALGRAAGQDRRRDRLLRPPGRGREKRAIPGLRHVRDRHMHHAIICTGQDPAEVFASFPPQLSAGNDLAARRRPRRAFGNVSGGWPDYPARGAQDQVAGRWIEAKLRLDDSTSIRLQQCSPWSQQLWTRDPNSRGRKPNSLLQSAPPQNLPVQRPPAFVHVRACTRGGGQTGRK